MKFSNFIRKILFIPCLSLTFFCHAQNTPIEISDKGKAKITPAGLIMDLEFKNKPFIHYMGVVGYKTRDIRYSQSAKTVIGPVVKAEPHKVVVTGRLVRDPATIDEIPNLTNKSTTNLVTVGTIIVDVKPPKVETPPVEKSVMTPPPTASTNEAVVAQVTGSETNSAPVPTSVATIPLETTNSTITVSAAPESKPEDSTPKPAATIETTTNSTITVQAHAEVKATENPFPTNSVPATASANDEGTSSLVPTLTKITSDYTPGTSAKLTKEVPLRIQELQLDDPVDFVATYETDKPDCMTVTSTVNYTKTGYWYQNFAFNTKVRLEWVKDLTMMVIGFDGQKMKFPLRDIMREAVWGKSVTFPHETGFITIQTLPGSNIYIQDARSWDGEGLNVKVTADVDWQDFYRRSRGEKMTVGFTVTYRERAPFF